MSDELTDAARFCSECGKGIDGDSTFCRHCGAKQDLSAAPAIRHTLPNPPAATVRTQIRWPIVIVLAVIAVPIVAVVGIVIVVMILNAVSARSISPIPSTVTAPSVANLTTENGQAALNRWMSIADPSGGRVTIVGGIREVPSQNIATADVQLSNFHYQSARGYGQRLYSGLGTATFVHYTDGRWVLTRIETADAWYGLTEDPAAFTTNAEVQ
jgi:hypothetical protein